MLRSQVAAAAGRGAGRLRARQSDWFNETRLSVCVCSLHNFCYLLLSKRDSILPHLSRILPAHWFEVECKILREA